MKKINAVILGCYTASALGASVALYDVYTEPTYPLREEYILTKHELLRTGDILNKEFKLRDIQDYLARSKEVRGLLRKENELETKIKQIQNSPQYQTESIEGQWKPAVAAIGGLVFFFSSLTATGILYLDKKWNRRIS